MLCSVASSPYLILALVSRERTNGHWAIENNINNMDIKLILKPAHSPRADVPSPGLFGNRYPAGESRGRRVT